MAKNVFSLSVEDREEWDDFVSRSPQGHLLQSFGWGELKAAFGWRPERVALRQGEEIVAGAQALFRPTPIGAIAYIPRGPVVDLNSDLTDTLLDAIHEVARSRGAFLLKMEPNSTGTGSLFACDAFCPSAQVIQPKTTFMVDLRPDLETITARQKSKARYNVGLARRKGVAIREAGIDDLPVFYRLLEETSRRDRFPIHSYEYYQRLFATLGKNLKLLLASYEGEILAGIVVSIFGTEAIYLYGASGNSHRNLMPNHLLQWEAMRLAKEQGCTRYDLWGVPDSAESSSGDRDDPLKAAQGLYRFKEGFGGDLVRYPGAFDHVYSTWRYVVWSKMVPRLQRFRGRGFG